MSGVTLRTTPLTGWLSCFSFVFVYCGAFVDLPASVTDRQIDEIYYLQGYKEGWKDGKWEEKMDQRECIERNSFVEVYMTH